SLNACPSAPTPPATRTRPSSSSVEVWFARAVDIEGVERNALLFGLNRSADALTPPSVFPPVMSIRPSYRRTAEAPARATDMSLVGAHVFAGTCGAVARPSRLKDTSTVAMAAAQAVDRLIVLVERLARIVVMSISRFQRLADSKFHYALKRHPARSACADLGT